ncbi:MAG: YdcF family protein [Polyangiaceae bacterium]
MRRAILSLVPVLALVMGCGGRPHHRSAQAAEPTVAGSALNAGWDGVRYGSRIVFRERSESVSPAPPEALGSQYSRCEAELRARGIDVARENGPALLTARAIATQASGPFDLLVVPGFTPLDLAAPASELHPEAQARLLRALDDLRAGAAPLVMVSGGNVHPDGTPFNEALEMKRFLIAHGVPEARVVVEPCARHSHTNVRNVARFMLSTGLRRALIVTSIDQAYYFANPRASSFDARCLSDLGYLVGAFEGVDMYRVAFEPSGRTLAVGPDPRDP